jgi:tetratricopeptide (TPR) repeat protein
VQAFVRPILAVLLALSNRPAEASDIHVQYDSPLGRIRIAEEDGRLRGLLVSPARGCRLSAGEEVLRGTLLDDSIAGEIRVCLSGKACGAKEVWANAVLLASGDRLSGAVHVRVKGCAAPIGRNGGITFTKVVNEAVPPGRTRGTTKKATKREQARAVLRDGAAHLGEGNFEAARRRFLDAIAIDAGVPEAYNGVGVTYRMRNDLAGALDWYKKALGVDPDFGDAYYNMACVYALRGETALALRYLQIAAMNGYATAEGIDGDPDLEGVRGDPAYRALVQARL